MIQQYKKDSFPARLSWLLSHNDVTFSAPVIKKKSAILDRFDISLFTVSYKENNGVKESAHRLGYLLMTELQQVLTAQPIKNNNHTVIYGCCQIYKPAVTFRSL